MTSYQSGIPTGTVNLDVDYQNIQNNFQQLDTTYGKDHVAYSQALNNGYHNFVRLVPQATPGVISNIGQIFDQTSNDGVNTDQTLFFKTGNNRLMQLTRNFMPTQAAKGATFLPGGFILNWGNIVTGNVPGDYSTLFLQKFPFAVYVVVGSGQTVSSPNTGAFVVSSSVSTSGFTVRNISNNINNFNWIAIGL